MERPSIYRHSKPVADTNFQRDGNGNIVTAIVDALAEAQNVAPTDLRPLYESIDTDAIADLFERDDGVADTYALLNFEVDRWSVYIRSDGRIRICDGTQSTPPQPVFEGNAN